MASSGSLPSLARQCRDRLKDGRGRIESRFRAGLPSVQTATALTDLYDEVVRKIWDASLERAASQVRPSQLAQLTLVAHGGYGRRDLSPYSDADLMLLTPRRSAAAAAQVASTLVRDITDAGIDCGFSVRTPRECCTLAWSDPKIYTSLTESRYCFGSEATFDRYFDRFRAAARRRRNFLNHQALEARREERHKWGETNYLLRPNVKRSRGGLRDIQLVRWLGFSSYGATSLEQLHKLNALSEEDFGTLRRAHAFMLRLRHELHFRAKRAQDVLDRPTQLDIAEDWGYQGRLGVLPVEDFMQDYFEHTRGVRYVAAYFHDDTRIRSRAKGAIESVVSKRIDDRIRMGPTHIWVKAVALDAFAQSLPDVLRLIQLANRYSRRIAHPTWQAIRKSMQERETGSPDPESVRAFLELLGESGRLASLLRRLHELRIIEQLIPAMERCRGLLQFNAYHKYTVDAHCIRAVEAATDFEEAETSMGRRYRRLKDKTLLHLALLIHDLGKGYEEDHSEVGRRIALEVADAFGMSAEDKDTLQWLIHRHLLINEVAFRHDLNDPEVVHKFAVEVGSIARLELLLIHTVADLQAVGPDVLNDWKMGLIEDLYLRARRYFETGNLPGENELDLDSKIEQVGVALGEKDADPSLIQFAREMPLSLLRQHSTEDLIHELHQVGEWLSQNPGCYCTGAVDPAASAVRYTIVLRLGEQRIGIFARITAAFSACGLSIMRANVETVGQDLLWDQFWVNDPELKQREANLRIDEVCQVVSRAIDEPESVMPTPRRVWQTQGAREPSSVLLLPTKIVFDNDTFDHQTILSIFAYDRPALLSSISKTLSDMNVVIQFAKIDTHLDQIADVFYVTNLDETPITDSEQQEQIRTSLVQAIGEMPN
ncbi:[protein-PII] uridylyltransferase [Rhodopirellula halodulae]|uniref:[protein-PII] uridylyltransferase n=1 Tax=Rhodopirellula halodulae TaxID=2894198 RepID=UPI001E2B8E51|nr:[protein-PII] uridylyltransferase [Rhodopirellula sp. JC737]MCC9656383.1 [protein-PII] uridylyltransferase [Rhodopirellula sp. JC737]